VAISEQLDDRPLEGELLAVAEAAGARLRAETDQDDEASRAAAEALVSAASAAMGAGHSLTAIASAEADGKDTVRQALRDDALRLVESTGEQARAMRAEHYQAIARATRLGLAMREIAQAAGVAHGTIRAINNRLAGGSSGDLDIDPTEDGHSEDEG
jgi:DNA-binding NarL/FixJ family response regulator